MWELRRGGRIFRRLGPGSWWMLGSGQRGGGTGAMVCIGNTWIQNIPWIIVVWNRPRPYNEPDNHTNQSCDGREPEPANRVQAQPRGVVINRDGYENAPYTEGREGCGYQKVVRVQGHHMPRPGAGAGRKWRGAQKAFSINPSICLLIDATHQTSGHPERSCGPPRAGISEPLLGFSARARSSLFRENSLGP